MAGRAAFEAEWFDTFAGLLKKFTVIFYESDNTVEVSLVSQPCSLCLLFTSVSLHRFTIPAHEKRS